MNSYTEAEVSILRLYHDLKTSSNPKGKVDIAHMMLHKNLIEGYVTEILQEYSTKKHPYLPSGEVMHALIMLTLDQYTYSESGEVLITDSQYDQLMQIWMRDYDGNQIIYPDSFDNAWPMVEHFAPWMVGSIRKTYDMESLENYCYETISMMHGKELNWVVAPKFDGVSCVMHIKNGKIVQAMTRGDRALGQDITPLAQRLSNADEIVEFCEHYGMNDGYVKTELCVPAGTFDHMREAGYANRRSATTAVVNTPKNLQYAKYLVGVILLLYTSSSQEGGKVIYIPDDGDFLKNPSPRELLANATEKLHFCKTPYYPYRVDGVVLYPLMTDINTSDVMELAMAFKINTAQAETQIKRAYISIGRLGHAIPMIEVEPCEVNETIVTDVNLGSFPIFEKYGLHERETVIIYSAGDVIPQMKLPKHRDYPNGAPLLRLKMVCPYCGERLKDYCCTNPLCSHRMSGRIANFIAKLGVEDVSDSTVDLLVEHRRVEDISDLFTLTERDLEGIPGIGKGKSQIILNRIDTLRNKPITYSELYGAIGIPGVSMKLCYEIFQKIRGQDFLKLDSEELRFQLMGISAIGPQRADSIVDFRDQNLKEIMKLAREMTIVPDKCYYGNVVFTGFRDKEWAAKFDHIGYTVSDTLNSNTVCVIAANMTTSKAIRAQERGIPLFRVSDIDKAFQYVEEGNYGIS